MGTDQVRDNARAAILVRDWTGPQDANGVVATVAVVTEEGGTASHAAVLSRALDTPCVAGCGPGTLDALEGQEITVVGSADDAPEFVFDADVIPAEELDESLPAIHPEPGRWPVACSPPRTASGPCWMRA